MPGRVIDAPDMTASLISAHLAYLRTIGLSDETLRQRRQLVYRFRDWLTTHTTCRRVVDAGLVEVHEWLNSLGASTEPASRGLYVSHLSAYFDWLIEQGIATDNPAKSIRIKRPKRFPRPVPQDDYDVIRSYTIQPEATWLLLAGGAGLRAMEIARLQCDYLISHGSGDERRWWLYVWGKGDKEREVPIGSHVARALLPFRAAAGSGHLFRRESGAPVTAKDVSRRCNHVLKVELGLPYTVHQLRHRFGTELYDETKDLRLTQEMMGHQSPQTTALYTRTSLERGRSAVERIGSGRHLSAVS